MVIMFANPRNGFVHCTAGDRREGFQRATAKPPCRSRRSGIREGFQRATAKPFGRLHRDETPVHNHAHHA